MVTRFSKIFLVFSLVLVGIFLIYSTVNAAGLVPCGRLQNDPSTPDVNETNPCTTCDIFALASRVINFVLFTVVPAVAVLFYLIGGLMILLSRGNTSQITTGKNFFWNTTWGLVIIFGAYMITNTVLKSLAGDSDYSKSWFRIECTVTVQQPPATITKYACNSLNKCVVNQEEGTFINDPNCGGKCVAAQTFYICDQDTNQCRVDPEGNTTDSYTTSNCDNECGPVFKTVSLPDATVDQDYNQTIAVEGGTAPYVFSLASGSLQGVFNLSSDGKITGKPPAAGSAVFTVKVEDSSDPKLSTTREFTIKVVYSGAISITTTSLPDAVVNTRYNATINASGGKAPHTFSVASGNPPPGMIIGGNGAITGTFATAGTYTLTVKVEDSTTPTKQSAVKQLSIKVNASLSCPAVGNLCNPVSSTSCTSNACGQYSSAISQAAAKISTSGINSASIIRSIMFNESTCEISAYNSTEDPDTKALIESCGPMQMQPETADRFDTRCGLPDKSVTCDFLRNPANINATVCLGAMYIQSIAGGTCGSQIRNIAAGYNAGIGNCAPDPECGNSKSCDGSAVRKWECPYDRVDNRVVCNTRLNETRTYAPKVLACYNKQ